MAIQTVTILVQSAIILVLGVGAAWGWRTAWKLSVECVGRKQESINRNAELIRTKEDLLKALAGKPIYDPLPRPALPRPKEKDPVTRAKSPAHVRQLTESAFGAKPGEEYDA